MNLSELSKKSKPPCGETECYDISNVCYYGSPTGKSCWRVGGHDGPHCHCKNVGPWSKIKIEEHAIEVWE